MPNFRSFLTGSRAYGEPRPDSDIDLVVYVNQADLALLVELCGNDDSDVVRMASDKSAPHYLENMASLCLRFGALNLLACQDEKAFEVWRLGTAHLRELKKKHGPVGRDYAIWYFRTLRKKADLCTPEPGPQPPLKAAKEPPRRGLVRGKKVCPRCRSDSCHHCWECGADTMASDHARSCSQYVGHEDIPF